MSTTPNHHQDKKVRRSERRVEVREHQGHRVQVRELVVESARGTRTELEITVFGLERQVAVVDVADPRDLALLVHQAVDSFVSSIRVRRGA